MDSQSASWKSLFSGFAWTVFECDLHRSIIFWQFSPRFGGLIGASWDSNRESEADVVCRSVLLALWCRSERMLSRTAQAENVIEAAKFG
jgi:hypothetical protein